MRTTIDLDERALAAGRAKATSERISLGRAISELVFDGLTRGVTTPQDFPSFAPVPGHIITDDLVAQYQDE